MRRLICILIALLATQAFAISPTIFQQPNGDWWSGATGTGRDVALLWARAMENEVEALGQGSTGSTFYVDSGVSNEGDGSSWTNAKDTLDEAINLCTANAGDIIYVAPGHAESGSAAGLWDADVAGITIIGLGNGALRPTFTFADTDTTVVLGAASIKIQGLRFAAGISEVVTGISVEAAADDCMIYDCDFPEPSTSTFEFDKAIVLAAGADRLSVIGCSYSNADATGATNVIDCDAGVQTGTAVIGCYFIGEFAEGAIHSDDVDLEVLIADNVITNMTSGQHGIEFTANATGWMVNNIVSTDAIGTSYDPGRLGDSGNYWDDFDTYDTSAVLWATNETGVNRFSASELAQIEAEAVDAITTTANLSEIGDKVQVDIDANSTRLYWQERSVTVDVNFAASATDLFTVTGGPILITGLFGQCTTAAGGSPGTMTIECDATAGSDYDNDLSTTVNVDALGAGDTIRFTNAIDEGVLTLTANTGAGQQLSWYAPAGTIEQTLSSTGTGDVSWYMTYIPLTTGVTVAAAP